MCQTLKLAIDWLGSRSKTLMNSPSHTVKVDGEILAAMLLKKFQHSYSRDVNSVDGSKFSLSLLKWVHFKPSMSSYRKIKLYCILVNPTSSTSQRIWSPPTPYQVHLMYSKWMKWHRATSRNHRAPMSLSFWWKRTLFSFHTLTIASIIDLYCSMTQSYNPCECKNVCHVHPIYQISHYAVWIT